MEDDKHKQFREGIEIIYRKLIALLSIIGIVVCVFIYIMLDPNFTAFHDSEVQSTYTVVDEEAEWDKIVNGIHVRTGLIEADGLMETVNNCTNCHSAKLVTQNRMSSENWAATIDWMQETQNLWDLGGNEEIIINYLVTNYPPQKKGRRQALTNIEWYELKD
jgi:hypothetical protein